MKNAEQNELFAGRYRLIKQLGRGGFGKIYLAEQEAFGLTFRSVALKIFEHEIQDHIQARQILNDAVILARLLEECEDPQVKSRFVQVFDIGTGEMAEKNQTPVNKGYITMELMDQDLRSVVGSPGSEGFKKASVKQMLAYMKPVVEALAYMHSQDPPVLHRDLKPENVLLKKGREKLQIKVADFGLAVQSFNLVDLPQAAGTVPYQDLESFTRRTASTECDVYAIGVMFYEFMTGKYPYKFDFSQAKPGDPLANQIFSDLLKQAMAKPIEPPSSVNFELKSDPWLEDLILRCLTPERIDRIKDAVELKRLMEKRSLTTLSTGKTADEKYKVYLSDGKKAIEQGKQSWPEAEALFNKAVNLLPQHCDAVVALASLYADMKKLDAAEQLLVDRVQANRDCPHVYDALATVYEKRGNHIMRDFYADKAKKTPGCQYTISKLKGNES